MVLKCVRGSMAAMTGHRRRPAALQPAQLVSWHAADLSPAPQRPPASLLRRWLPCGGLQAAWSWGGVAQRTWEAQGRGGGRAGAPGSPAARPPPLLFDRPPLPLLCPRARRTQTCRFSGLRIYPGKGVLFIRVDGQVRSRGSQQAEAGGARRRTQHTAVMQRSWAWAVRPPVAASG